MDYLLTQPATPRPRTATPDWEDGDLVLVDGVRWIIRRILPDGEVVLVAANVAAGAATWITDLNTLPAKES